MLARSGLPGERPGGPMPAHAGKATKTTPPTAGRADRRSELGDTRRPPRRARLPADGDVHGSPPRLGGRRGERDHGARVRGGRIAPVAAGRGELPAPRDRGGARLATRRGAGGARSRTRSRRRSTRGSCGSPRGGRSTTSRWRSTRPPRGEELLGGELEAPGLRKTDTATYVEAVARERPPSPKVAARGRDARRRRRAPCPRPSRESTDGRAPAPARGGGAGARRSAARERYRGAAGPTDSTPRGGRRLAALRARFVTRSAHRTPAPRHSLE